jgi:CheY-like chemotaxis protein
MNELHDPAQHEGHNCQRMSMSGRVLVVDDEPSLRRLLTDLFSIEGYRVSAASDGAQALERLQHFRPDVVVLDLTMPVMNGFMFAERCHQIDGYAELPIVAVTAMHDIQSAAPHLQHLGVRKCLAKPFDVAELLAAVEQFARPNRTAERN